MAEASSSEKNEFLLRLEVDSEDGTEYLDRWDTVEKLLLASTVVEGDKSVISAAKHIKPFLEHARPADWYSPKNCALQYTKMLNEVDNEPRRKLLPRTEKESAVVTLMKNLKEQRLRELSQITQNAREAYNGLKAEMIKIDNGEYDDRLDDMLAAYEERDKKEMEQYNEYMAKRDRLNSAKKLNRSKVIKGKAKSKGKVIDAKSRSPTASNLSDEAAIRKIMTTVESQIKAEESSRNPNLNAMLDNKIAPPSPLLTSLLRSITSSTPSGAQNSLQMTSPVREYSSAEGVDQSEMELGKSREASPRGSVPQSPRPTPASSPLLNSLLKNTPHSSPIHISPAKEGASKTGTSPQPFFISSSLSSASQQQSAAVTPTAIHSFFQLPEIGETKKIMQSPPTSSTCLSAPTLSKLLEMPPSTPGHLPPLPIVDNPATAANNLQTQDFIPANVMNLPTQTPESIVLQKSSISYSQLNRRDSVDKVKDIDLDEKFKLMSNDSFGDIISDEDLSRDLLAMGAKGDLDFLLDVMKEDSGCLPDSLQPSTSSLVGDQKFLSKQTVAETDLVDLPEDVLNLLNVGKDSDEILSKDVKTPVKDSLPLMKIKIEPISPGSLEAKEAHIFSEVPKTDFDFQNVLTDVPIKQENVDDSSLASKRSIIKAKRRLKKSPVPELDCGDQYEFIDVKEESSVHSKYKPLCHTSRSKDGSRFEEKKTKGTKEKETIGVVPSTSRTLTPTETKLSHNQQLKQGKMSTATRRQSGIMEDQTKFLRDIKIKEEVIEKDAPTFPVQKHTKEKTPSSSVDSDLQSNDSNTSTDVSTHVPSSSHSTVYQYSTQRKQADKTWKKAIGITLREAGTHRYANLFLNKVTNEIAPAYLDKVKCPTDLSAIKKSIDNGTISNTREFHREMMLMFQNALIYNNDKHDVFGMTHAMQRSFFEQIYDFEDTQSQQDG